ncbi:DNA topoisomerase [Geoalkalibacter halelectricus]|uniref:DNA topoisomerase n=1 Tax=Geoalkalibacter halelectricus TaxID=2847045 RepID=UPI003D1B4F7A
MLKQLILAEKKSVALDLCRALEPEGAHRDFYIEGSRHVITWGKGHLVQLCEPEHYDARLAKWDLATLPILPERYDFRVVKTEQARFERIQQLLKRADIERVILATDPGREGEVIGRLILEKAGSRKPLYRFWTSQALTEQAVREAMENLRPSYEFDALYEAGLARLIADWLVGINGTRALTSRAARSNFTWPLGRVKGPVVGMVARRQELIDRFEPQVFWSIRARFVYDGHLHYSGSWIGSGGREEQVAFLPEDEDQESEQQEQGVSLERLQESTRIFYRYQANKIINRACPFGLRLEKRKRIQRFTPRAREDGAAVEGFVKDILSEEKKIAAPRLFNSSTLLQQAYYAFGFPVEKSEALAQRLYQLYKLITYPRSESRVLPQNAQDMVHVIMRALGDDGLVFERSQILVDPKNKRHFDDSEIIEGHHAIIPTGIAPEKLSRDEKSLYDLIVQRFLAAFHPPFRYRSMQVLTEVGGEIFSSRKTIVVDAGWKGFLKERLPEPSAKEPLELLKKGKAVTLQMLSLAQGMTSPPLPYNDATLIHDMTHVAKFVDDPDAQKVLRRCSGIGTSATRGRIIKDIVDAGYVIRRGKGRGLCLEPKGRALVAVLGDQEIMDPGTTAIWESRLEKIAREEGGDRDYLLNGVMASVVKLVEDIRTIPHALLDTAKIVGPCPECGDSVVERPRSFACRQAPSCPFILWKDRLAKLGKTSISAEEMRQLLAGGAILLSKLKGKHSRLFDTRGYLAKTEHGWNIKFLKNDEPPPGLKQSVPQSASLPVPTQAQIRMEPELPLSVPCLCSNQPVPEVSARPSAADPQVMRLACRWLLARLEQKGTEPDASLLEGLLAHVAVEGFSQQTLREFLEPQGRWPSAGVLAAEIAHPQTFLDAAYYQLCFGWIEKNRLGPRSSTDQLVRFFVQNRWHTARIVDSHPQAGAYRLLVETLREPVLVPWEKVFCSSCNRSGIIQCAQS